MACPFKSLLDKTLTEGEGDEEHVVNVIREKRRGRPQGPSARSEGDDLDRKVILEEKLRFKSNDTPTSPIYPTRAPHIPATPKVPLGTSSRPEVFLLGKRTKDLSVSKIPKSGPVLRCYMFHLENGDSKKMAAGKTTQSVKISWKHHCGIRVIFGKDFETDDKVDESVKIVSSDKYIGEKIDVLHIEYIKLEKTSRKPDRAKTKTSIEKVDMFVKNTLEMPFNITKKNFEYIFEKKSGIKDWKEDVEHLKKQLQKDQASSCDAWDVKQKKKDYRKLAESVSADKKVKQNQEVD